MSRFTHANPMTRTVTLCDEHGTPLGQYDLLDAHLGQGKLHIAFSVYLFNKDLSKIVIQQRSQRKMLWPGIWANTCCSHPFEHESALDAGTRRLTEEIGIQAMLTPELSFVYRAEDPDARGVEHEYVTVLFGQLDEHTHVQPNPEEIHAWKWITIDDVLYDMQKNPASYAPWFHQGFTLLLQTERFRTRTTA